MQYTYTTIISKKDSTFYAKIPDIDSCITTGKSFFRSFTPMGLL